MKKIDIKLNKVKVFCECKGFCLQRGTQHHHMFPNTKNNRKLYGDLLDEDENILFASNRCHEKMGHYSEVEFCEALGIEPRSKVGRSKARFG